MPMTKLTCIERRDCTYPFDQFKAEVDLGMFTDDDGIGYWGTEREVSDITVDLSNIVPPSPAFTHVVWYNK